MPGMDIAPKYKDQRCYGLDLRKIVPSARIELSYLLHFYQLAKKQGIPFFESSFDMHIGNKLLRKQLEAGLTEDAIRASWQPALRQYNKIRKKYLLYPDK